ncbi:MAG: helix-turn-helix domain-containing protein [Lachnospiraceae bacterium]|nr:helix-turn-helix domain-containing protein [Lachnospiraceae bacterium]
MYFDVKEVGERIRALRMGRNITQAEVAEALNISIEHYKRIETGRRGCSIDILISVKMYFGVSLDYLVLGETPNVEAEQIKSELEDVIGRLSLLHKSI